MLTFAIINQDPLQQMAASVAPNFVVQSQQNQPQIVHQQQQQANPQVNQMGPFVGGSLSPHQMAALRQHQQHHQSQPKPMNPFIAAALAGNYGPAQQQMAAASLQHQRILPPPQQLAQHPGAHAHHHHSPQQAVLHNQPNPMHMPHPHQHGPQQQQMIPPSAQQQAFLAQREPVAPISVAESSIRSNIIPAPASAQDEPVGGNIDEHGQSNGQSSELTASASSTSSAVTVQQQQQQQNNWPLQAPDVPKITNLEVKCEKNLMKVSIEFDKIFNGVIFSKGHFSQGQCVHVNANSGKQQAYFDIGINTCGTQGNTQNGLYGMGGNTGSGTFFENTIVIQYDPNVQEVYDHARKLRCTWHDQYEKAVTFRPFPVDMLDIVRADFAGDNVGCWMQIQVGKGKCYDSISVLESSCVICSSTSYIESCESLTEKERERESRRENKLSRS